MRASKDKVPTESKHLNFEVANKALSALGMGHIVVALLILTLVSNLWKKGGMWPSC